MKILQFGNENEIYVVFRDENNILLYIERKYKEIKKKEEKKLLSFVPLYFSLHITYFGYISGEGRGKKGI